MPNKSKRRAIRVAALAGVLVAGFVALPALLNKPDTPAAAAVTSGGVKIA